MWLDNQLGEREGEIIFEPSQDDHCELVSVFIPYL